MSVDKYLEASKRDIFQWECVETTDGYGMGGVQVEFTKIGDSEATITRESDNEFEVEVVLKYPIEYNGENTYEVIEYRSNRKSARNLAEKLIKNDLKKDIVVTEYQLELMQHAIGFKSYKKNKPYRNRFFTQETDKDWNELVEKKLAIKGSKHPNNDEFVYFWLTKFGVEYVLGKNISDNKYSDL